MYEHQRSADREKRGGLTAVVAASAVSAAAVLGTLTSVAAARPAREAGRAAATSIASPAALSGQVTVRIRDDEGLSPAEASVGAGTVIIAVDNRSSTTRLVLRISREDGERVREIVVPEGATSWSTQVELQAGTYLLTEASTMGWACRLTVR